MHLCVCKRQSYVVFSSISQSYTHLSVRLILKGSFKFEAVTLAKYEEVFDIFFQGIGRLF